MSKKVYICRGKSCKNADPEKSLEKYAKKIVGKKSIKKTKCLGLCKSAFAIEYKGEKYSCISKKDMEEILPSKK